MTKTCRIAQQYNFLGLNIIREFSLLVIPVFLISTLGFSEAQESEVADPIQNRAPAAAIEPEKTTLPATALEAFLGPENAWDRSYSEFQAWKEKTGIPLSIGGHSWFHADRDNFVYGDGYGIPGQRGTYYYYAALDPRWDLSPDSPFAPFEEWGLNIQGRFRDTNDKLRPFYSGTSWLYESYAYLKSDEADTVKVGKQVTDFGLAWDNSWWEGVPYFDGYSFDPDYGISWKKDWNISNKLTVTSNFQFYWAEDGINGSINGADAESVPGFNERNTVMVHVTPTWKLSDAMTFAWGFSGLVGELENGDRLGLDESRAAFGTDVTLAKGALSLYGEYIDNHGAVNPTRYVSGGPSDRQNSVRLGANYQPGWLGARINWSRGFDHNPDGDQWIIAPGITAQLAKSLTLYAEYVNWEVTNQSGATAIFDDGFELILVWGF